MNRLLTIFEDESFDKYEWAWKDLTDFEFSGCCFRNINFSNYQLIRTSFSDCRFISCNISNADVEGCRFQGVNFCSCKILGIVFAKISPFLLNWEFNDCQLQLCNFSGLNMKKSSFISSKIHESDFVNVDLQKSSFKYSDLSGSRFHNADMTGTDFSDAKNFFIDVTTNKLKGAKFSLPEVLNLLHQFGIKIEY